MTNEQMITDLKNMARQALRMWGIEEDSAKEALHTQAYALCCTAIAALNAPKPFLQIGPDFINRSDIVRVEILEAKTYTGSDKIMWPKRVKVIFRDIDGGELSSPYSCFKEYPFDSPEGQTLLEWLQGQSEVLIPYEDPLHIQPDYEDSVNREFQSEELAYVAGKEDSMPQDIEDDYPF